MQKHWGRGWSGHRGRGGWQQADLPSAEDAAAWFAGRLPDGWFVESPRVTVDREEIIIVGELPGLEGEFAGSTDDAARSAGEVGRISRFREDTRDERIEIARQAEHRY